MGGIGKTESDRRELDSAAGAGSISQGSDQPRCCGNPSRTYASAPSAVADCTAPYKLHAIPIGTESQLRSCRYTNVLGGVRARRGLFSSSRPKCGRTPQVTTSVSAGPEVRAPPQRPLPRTDRLRSGSHRSAGGVSPSASNDRYRRPVDALRYRRRRRRVPRRRRSLRTAPCACRPVPEPRHKGRAGTPPSPF